MQTTRGRLVLLVVTVAVVMLSTSALLHYVFDQFDDYGEALWSAAVHLVDPGALVETRTPPNGRWGCSRRSPGWSC